MISYVLPLAIGNAIRIGLQPVCGALSYRVLRRNDQNFAGASDPAAMIVSDGPFSRAVLDVSPVNGTPYFYADFALVNGEWIADSVVQATANASYGQAGVDPQEFVRERLALGLAVEVAAGSLTPQSGVIKVLTAPFALQEGVTFPVASVHLESADSSNRFLGDELVPGFEMENGQWSGSHGWIGRYTLNIIGVSLNPDERIALRKAIQRIMIGNMALFAAAGFEEINFTQRDTEQFQENNAPLYRTDGTFDCLAPTMITLTAPPALPINVNGIPVLQPDLTET